VLESPHGEPASGLLWLELTGPSGTRELLAAEVGDTADETSTTPLPPT